MTLVLPLRQGIVLKFYKNVKKKLIIPKYSEYKISDTTIFSIILDLHTKCRHYICIIFKHLSIISIYSTSKLLPEHRSHHHQFPQLFLLPHRTGQESALQQMAHDH